MKLSQFAMRCFEHAVKLFQLTWKYFKKAVKLLQFAVEVYKKNTCCERKTNIINVTNFVRENMKQNFDLEIL